MTHCNVGEPNGYPFRWVKADCCGIGLGSFVTCRHRPSAFKAPAPTGGLACSCAGVEQQGGHATREYGAQKT